MKGDLTKVPGVGKNMKQHLNRIDIHAVEDLIGRDPQELYMASCLQENSQLDLCVLYVYRGAVYFAEHETHDREKLDWWYWKDHVYPQKVRSGQAVI